MLHKDELLADWSLIQSGEEYCKIHARNVIMSCKGGRAGMVYGREELLGQLVYCGALSPAVPAEGFFDILTDAHDLLRG